MTTLYAIYAPGYTKENINTEGGSGELEIDLHEQNGSLDIDSKAYMCATGSINGGKVEFKFQNQTSIIAIEQMQTAANAELKGIKLYGVATTGKFSVKNEEIIFTPGTDVTGVTADVSNLDTKIVADGSGKILDRPIYFVAVPTAKADLSLKLTDSNGNVYENTSTLVPGTKIERSKYYHATKKLGIATVKVGSSETVYYSLPDAVSAVNKATADATLTLFSDVTVTETQKVSNENGWSITINLANKKIEGKSSPVLNIAGKVTLTAEDGGGVTNTGTGQAILVETDNTSLNIHGGTYEAEATYGTIRIYGGSSSTREIKVNVTIGENTKVLAKGAGKRAIYSGKDDNNAADLTINGGYFKSEEDAAIFLAWGKATVNEGTFIGKYGLRRKGDPEKVECTINGGYFYGKGDGGVAIYISSDPGKANKFIFGGFFSSEPTNEWLATNYGKAKTSFTDTEGNSYKWAVLTNNNALKSIVSNPDGLTNAIEAAKEASGDYTISLQADVKLAAKTNENYDIKGEGVRCAMYDITNKNGKKITILLNGYTLTLPGYRSVITTTGNLEIKGGVVLGSQNRLFVLWDAGELNIEDCLIQTSGTNYNVTVDSSAIVVHGADADNPAGKISVKGSYVQTKKTTRTSLVGVSYGRFEVKDSYLSIGHYGYHGIKVHQGAEVTVDNTSIYTPFTDPSSIPGEKTTWSASAILFQGPAKSVVVKGGSHLYGGKSSIYIGNKVEQASVTNLKIESGYFNTDIWNLLEKWKNIPEGNTWKQVQTQFYHKTKWGANYSDESVDLEYGYQVSSK